MGKVKINQKTEAFILLAHGFTQKEIANKVNVTQKTLCQWSKEYKKLHTNNDFKTIELLKERLHTMITDKNIKASEIKIMIEIIERKEKSIFYPKEAL